MVTKPPTPSIVVPTPRRPLGSKSGSENLNRSLPKSCKFNLSNLLEYSIAIENLGLKKYNEEAVKPDDIHVEIRNVLVAWMMQFHHRTERQQLGTL